MKKPGWLKDTIAKPNGYYTPKGELVKRKSLSKEEIDAWNGVKAAKPAPAPAPEFVAEPAVEEVETDAPASVDKAMNEPGDDADFSHKPGSKIVDMFKPRK
jgi:hypothetical protein